MGQWVSSNHNHADEYVGSALPFVTGNLAIKSGEVIEVNFPYVTRWIQVMNHGAHNLRLGFTENGVNANPNKSHNYLLLSGAADTGRLELKVGKVFLRGDQALSGSCSVLAGYTNIPVSNFPDVTGSNSFRGVG